jgi:TPR repeat protein
MGSAARLVAVVAVAATLGDPAMADDAERMAAEASRLFSVGSLQEAYALNSAAAEAGNAIAQYNLALMYHYGRGTAQDHQQARRWFLQAARSGVPQAMHNVAVYHDEGLGGPTDKAVALR